MSVTVNTVRSKRRYLHLPSTYSIRYFAYVIACNPISQMRKLSLRKVTHFAKVIHLVNYRMELKLTFVWSPNYTFVTCHTSSFLQLGIQTNIYIKINIADHMSTLPLYFNPQTGTKNTWIYQGKKKKNALFWEEMRNFCSFVQGWGKWR